MCFSLLDGLTCSVDVDGDIDVGDVGVAVCNDCAYVDVGSFSLATASRP